MTRSACLLSLVLAAATATSCHAQTAGAAIWPNRPIRIVVPTSPSTPPDLITRIVAAQLQKQEGWTIVVENKAGAMQTVAGRDVVRAPADGYSIWSMGMVSTIAPSLMEDVSFDVDKDFRHIIQATRSYNVLVTNPAVAAATVSDLVTLLKGAPGKYNYSSGGFGTPAHMIGELFKLKYGVEAAHVPYVQFPQAIGDLVGGVNHYMFITTLPVIELVKSGKLRGLAVTSGQRLAALPDTPTVAEAGFPDLAIGDWHGFSVRAETPQRVVDTLAAGFDRAIRSSEVRKALERIGAEPVGGGSQAFSELVRRDARYWAGVVKDAKIKLPN